MKRLRSLERMEMEGTPRKELSFCQHGTLCRRCSAARRTGGAARCYWQASCCQACGKRQAALSSRSGTQHGQMAVGQNCILPCDVFINLINPNCMSVSLAWLRYTRNAWLKKSALIAGLDADPSRLFNLFYRLSAVSGSLCRVVRSPDGPASDDPSHYEWPESFEQSRPRIASVQERPRKAWAVWCSISFARWIRSASAW